MSNDKAAATGYTPKNGDPFEVPLPPGAKPSDPYNNTTTWHDDHPGGEYALAAPLPKVKTPHPWLYPAFVGAALVLGAVCGAILTPNQTPAACEQALTYAEQAIGQSGKGMEAMGNAVGGNMGKMMKAQTELEAITAELTRLTPLYKDAKKECLK